VLVDQISLKKPLHIATAVLLEPIKFLTSNQDNPTTFWKEIYTTLWHIFSGNRQLMGHSSKNIHHAKQYNNYAVKS